MVNNSHQRQQSEQSPLNSDGQQFTPISTTQRITSKQRWTKIPPISTKQTNTSRIVDQHCLEVFVCFVDIGVNC
jgi:hypothetical protein